MSFIILNTHYISSPVHSLILDLEDVLWDDEERFTEDEKEEILNIAPNELLNEANEELSNIFSILNGKVKCIFEITYAILTSNIDFIQ